MDILQEMSAVAAVLGLLGGTLWWLRRRGYAVSTRGGGKAARRLECVERVALGPQQYLHLMRVGERALLVASSPAGCVLLETFRWGEIEVSPEVVR